MTSILCCSCSPLELGWRFQLLYSQSLCIVIMLRQHEKGQFQKNVVELMHTKLLVSKRETKKQGCQALVIDFRDLILPIGKKCKGTNSFRTESSNNAVWQCSTISMARNKPVQASQHIVHENFEANRPHFII